MFTELSCEWLSKSRLEKLRGFGAVGSNVLQSIWTTSYENCFHSFWHELNKVLWIEIFCRWDENKHREIKIQICWTFEVVERQAKSSCRIMIWIGSGFFSPRFFPDAAFLMLFYNFSFVDAHVSNGGEPHVFYSSHRYKKVGKKLIPGLRFALFLFFVAWA